MNASEPPRQGGSKQRPRFARHPERRTATSLARALSKLGFASRSQARELIAAGRVRVNGAVRRDAEWRVHLTNDRIEVDAEPVRSAPRVYLMLNKPRGLVTSASDEHGRPTVFVCLAGMDLPRVSPVGRLDKASEGLLLFTNDTTWANRISAPASHVPKTYHVQVDRVADGAFAARLERGVQVDGDFLAAQAARVLRGGTRNSWLEVVLVEGKNRHLRRLLAALDTRVLRLLRVAVGSLPLGDLAKGQFRRLTPAEVAALGG